MVEPPLVPAKYFAKPSDAAPDWLVSNFATSASVPLRVPEPPLGGQAAAPESRVDVVAPAA